MATTGRKFAQRTQDRTLRRLIDARTLTVLRKLAAPAPAARVVRT